MKCAPLLPTVGLALLGCFGYSTRSLLPPHLRTVALTDVENSTTRPGLAEEMNAALLRAFNADRNLRVTSADLADLAVAVTVVSYSRTAATYDAEQSISGYEVAVAASVAARDAVRDEEFFAGTVTARNAYDPGSRTEEAAAQEALEKLAAEVVRQIVTAW